VTFPRGRTCRSKISSLLASVILPGRRFIPRSLGMTYPSRAGCRFQGLVIWGLGRMEQKTRLRVESPTAIFLLHLSPIQLRPASRRDPFGQCAYRVWGHSSSSISWLTWFPVYHAAMANRTLAGVIFVAGSSLPASCPRDAKPSLVRSETAPAQTSPPLKIPNTSFAAGVVVSMEAPCPSIP